jgi:hypothetical protein
MVLEVWVHDWLTPLFWACGSTLLQEYVEEEAFFTIHLGTLKREFCNALEDMLPVT